MRRAYAIVGLLGMLMTVSACARRRPPSLSPYPGAGQEGTASWYGLEEQGRRTASGDVMDPHRLSAAHPSLPFGTQLRVTDVQTGRTVVVVVNDRGPFARGRILDLSYGAAQVLGIVEKGVAHVRLEVLSVDPGLLMTRWVVQVGSFRDEAQSQALRSNLEKDGYAPVRVVPVDVEGAVYYRVQVGVFTERNQAERFAQSLSRNGLQGLAMQVSVAMEK